MNNQIRKRLFEIRVNSTEKNKDLGFDILMNSGLSIVCLEDEKYVIPEEGIQLLKKRGVMYDLIAVNGEIMKNAPEVKD